MIPYSYLSQQFAAADRAEILALIDAIAARGDFTLGREVGELEAAFAKVCGVDHAIGVANGTDALELCLEATGFGERQVITSPFSFYATASAIVRGGCSLVFADVGPDFLIDPEAIEAAITPWTTTIMPVHWAGRPCDMPAIAAIAKDHSLDVIEDAAQAVGANIAGRACGAWGDAAGFSLHPLKTVNVWGDGGVVTTGSPDAASYIRKLRNHGMVDRDHTLFWGRNSRLDTIQAAIALRELARLDGRIEARNRNAMALNERLAGVGEVLTPAPMENGRCTWYLYAIRAQRRDELQAWLESHGIEAKVHYPVPLHLQPAAEYLGYKRGAFPVAEACADETLSLPVHEFVTADDIDIMAGLIRQFYTGRA